MAIPKIFGIETEFGIQGVGGGESNPVIASSILINAYSQESNDRVNWDFEDETPGNDARGFLNEGVFAPEVETHLVNTVLTNGGRYYVDHAHPEYSSPECSCAREAVLYDRAGEQILIRSMRAAERLFGEQGRIAVYKNNSDHKGNSYGCHENYLMDREIAFAKIAKLITAHFVSRIIYTGSGKVGSETGIRKDERGLPIEYQISQRAEFFEEEVGLETTLKRPIVNTRDEPHCDPKRYRRLHVICGDANMSEVACYLKLGVTGIILSMIEDGWLDKTDLILKSPVPQFHNLSTDISLKGTMELTSGRAITALEIQWAYYEIAEKYVHENGFSSIGEEKTGANLMERWHQCLSNLEADPYSANKTVDWVAKLELILAYMDRHNLRWDSQRLVAMDLQYHDLRPEKSLFTRLSMECLFDDEQVKQAMTEPPPGTRAYFRGKCLQKWMGDIATANWDSLVFDLGDEPLKRIPTMDPLKGTYFHVGKLIEECATPRQLLDKLES